MANKNDLGRSLAKDLLSHHPHPHNLHHPMHLSTFNDHLGNNKDDHHPLDFPSVSGGAGGGGGSVAEMPQQPKSAADLLKALSVPNQFPGAASNQLLQNLLSGLPGLPGVPPGLSPIANSVAAAAALAAALASSSSSNKDDTNSTKDQLHSKIQSDEMVSETEAGTVNGDATDRPADNNLDGMDQATIKLANKGEFHFQS